MVVRRLPVALIAGCGLAALAGAAVADPPSRVGRVSDVEGEVSFLPPEQPDWAQALRNYPVTSGEAFWTGDAGRVELQLGGVQAHVDSETELDVVELDYGDTRLSIPQGSVDIRVWRAPEGGVAIATPAGDVRLDQPGAYRIDVAAPDESGEYPPVEVTALEGGAAGAPGPGGFVGVPAGAAAIIYAGYDPQLQDAQDADIDDWARGREAQLRYDRVNWEEEAEPGFADLSGYGEFVQDPTYGQVWFPADVPPDWAPYRFGRWSYVEPWGWTWIDDQPWGFTPFHYGRWVNVGGRWGWTRGHRVARPVYAPALVAFIGGEGFGAGVGAGGGAFGWVPLAPDEPYIPPYRVSDAYVRQVNVASVSPTIINNVNVNTTTAVQPGRLKNAAAASAIPAEALSRGAKVQQAAVRVTPQALAQAHVSPPAAPAAPPRQGVSAGAPAGGAGRAGLHPAPPPPPKVQQLRAAVAQAPKGSTAPPAIPGVHKAAAIPPATAAATPIAPAAKSGRQPPPKPLATHPGAAPGAVQTTTPGGAPRSPAGASHAGPPPEAPALHRPPPPPRSIESNQPEGAEAAPGGPRQQTAPHHAAPATEAPATHHAPPPEHPGRPAAPPPQATHPPAVQQTKPAAKSPPKKPPPTNAVDQPGGGRPPG